MPKSGKKSQKKNAYISLADIKLSDYANSPHAGSVVRKKVYASTTANNIYALEKEWFEQESESFKNVDDDDEECTNFIKKRLHRSKHNQQREDNSGGIVYPLDLWYILGQYIKPEDICIFASICKGAYTVSRMYSFWMGLYKKNYQNVKHLPLRLQPYCIERPLCLKACVVRALFHFYPKFVNRPPNQSWDVHRLEKSPCVAMWYVKSSDTEWIFYFKFKSSLSELHSEAVLPAKPPPTSWMELEQEQEKDAETLLEEVNCNPENGYRILQVKSPNFVVTPCVMGSCLMNARMGLARDMTKKKLQLTFCFSSYIKTCKVSSSLASRECGGNVDIIEFDPVGSVVVLDWWNPRYPLVDKF